MSMYALLIIVYIDMIYLRFVIDRYIVLLANHYCTLLTYIISYRVQLNTLTL